MLSYAIRRLAMPAALLLACVLVAGLTACKQEKPAGSSASGDVAKTVACVNATCPIMGNPIDPAKVPVSLTRDFKGRKVGFCCGSCPPAWDKLTDEQKAAKLAASMAKPAK
jgi:hypothetical protein